MARQDKKERKRLKRKQKQLQLRKDKNQSLFQRLAKSTAPAICYMTRNWKSTGIASIQMLRPTPTGQVLLAFLVDIWCVGLKDAHAREGITKSDFFDFINQSADSSEGFAITDLATVRRLVAGAVVFSNRNGFKLPAKYERYLAAIGVTPADVANADLSDFGGPDGKLHYFGTQRFLQQRLIGSVDDFLRRPDVEYTMQVASSGTGDLQDYVDEGDGDEEDDGQEHDAEELDQDDDLDDDEDLDAASERLLAETLANANNWLAQSGEAPHPQLDEGMAMAINLWLSKKLQAPRHDDLLEIVNARLQAAPDPEALLAATNQARRYLDTLTGPEQLPQV